MANLNWDENARIKFGKCVLLARESKGLAQEELADLLCQELGKKYTQKKISNIELGKQKRPIPREDLDELAKILDLTDQDIHLANIAVIETASQGIIKEGRYLLSNAEHPEFKAHLGKYHCVFRSTDSSKDHINRAILEIFEETENHSCGAKIDILDDQGKSIKHYTGKFFINTHFQTCYFLLRGQVWEEVSMMIAPYFAPTVTGVENKFIIAQVLTSSAGKRKHRTVAHRMLISRKRLSDLQVDLACSQLRLNTDMIYIEPGQLNILQHKAEDELANSQEVELYQAVINACEMIRKFGREVSLLCIEESKIYDAKNLDPNANCRALVTALIRNYSDGVFHNKISETVLELFEAIVDYEI